MFLNASRLAKRELHHHEILATIVYSGGGVWVSVEWAGIVSASPAMSTYKNTATIGKRNNEKMDKLGNKAILGNWDWQPKKLKERFGQLTLSDVTLKFGKENDMLTRIGIRLGKTHYEVVNILKKLNPF